MQDKDCKKELVDLVKSTKKLTTDKIKSVHSKDTKKKS